MRQVVSILLGILVSVSSGAVDAATITVRQDGTGDFPVIQQALDVAAAGDTILIGPGQYLDKTSIRLPGWSHDIESFAYVTVDDLTIIGAGAGATTIGPAHYSADGTSRSPHAVTCVQGGDLRIAELNMSNTYAGVYVTGRLFMDRCALFNCSTGVSWEAVGSGGEIRDSQFDAVEASEPVAMDISTNGSAGGVAIAGCDIGHARAVVSGVDGVEFRDCSFSGGAAAMDVRGAARVDILRCEMTDTEYYGIDMSVGSGAVCSVEDSHIRSRQCAVNQGQPGGRFNATGSRLESESVVVSLHGESGPCTIRDSDLIRLAGVTVRCDAGTETVTHDFRNNYWRTTDEATIRSWIIDHDDDPDIGAVVLYSPFAGQSVPTESTSWGGLKAQFR